MMKIQNRNNLDTSIIISDEYQDHYGNGKTFHRAEVGMHVSRISYFYANVLISALKIL